jgi:O-acetyl-ADP-ribose deacetylase (regulator of RNase III)
LLRAGCKIGEAKLKTGYLLSAKHILHSVGSKWRGNTFGELELRASCYRNSLLLATKIAITTIANCLSEHPDLQKIIFCCFSENDLTIYEKILNENKTQ